MTKERSTPQCAIDPSSHHNPLPDPNDFPVFRLSRPNQISTPEPPPIMRLSCRQGARSAGDPKRRRERREWARPGARPFNGSLAMGMRSRAGASPEGSGAGRSTRTGPAGGRRLRRPRRADGAFVKSEAMPSAQSKTVRAERFVFAETHITPTVSGRRPVAPPSPH
jgi:hypothetical protein